MTVGQISHEAHTTTEDRSAIEVAETMDTEGVGVLVVEDDGTVTGIITDREIALAVAEHDGDLSDVTVGDVMTEDAHTLKEDDESLEAARTMAQDRGPPHPRCRRFRVADRAGLP